MPATRNGRKSTRPTSLLGHFQATKRSTSGAQTSAKAGKPVVVSTDNAKSKVVSTQKQAEPTAEPTAAQKQAEPTAEPTAAQKKVEPTAEATAAQKKVEPTAETSATPSEEVSIPESNKREEQRYSTPEAQTGGSSPMVIDDASRRTSLSPSPPVELLGSTKKPVTVRQDPDKNKLYLMISPSKRSSASPSGPSSYSKKASSRSAPGHLTRPLPVFNRQSSPTLDRTPIREDMPLPRQPPSAPRKRRLSQVDLDQLRKDNEESPLPQDKRRPSFRALGASQEAGLSLMHIRSPRDASPETLHRGISKSPSFGGSSDDELLITPRKVRQRPSGIDPPSFATPTKAAHFDDPFATPRPKPTISAGIFSSLAKGGSTLAPSASSHSRGPHVSNHSSDEENPFLDSSSVSLTASTFKQIPTLPYAISPGLPLPPHFNTILLLYAALEHALVVHLATTGTAGSSTSSMDSTLTDSFGQSVVRLPNLITFSALKPLVERTAGRRLGSVELAKLMYVWSNGRLESAPAVNTTTAPTKAVESGPTGGTTTADTLAGLGFLIGRQRCLDANGRRRWDWSLGIELTIKRARRQVTPPMQVSFGRDDDMAEIEMPSTPTKKGLASGVFGLDTPPSTPPSSCANKRRRENSGDVSCSSSPSASGVGREGMSFVALWNNGMEERKSEVGRRLRAIVAGEMEEWLRTRPETTEALEQTPVEDQRMSFEDDENRFEDDENQAPCPSTPQRRSQHRSVVMGAGGLPTPSSTRPDGRRRRVVDFSSSIMEVDTDGTRSQRVLTSQQESQEDPSSSSWSVPARGGVLTSWHPEFELKNVQPLPCAILPSLKENKEAFRLGPQSGPSSTRSTTTASPAAADEQSAQTTPVSSEGGNRAMSLMERIKAKEAAASASRRSLTDTAPSGMMTNVKRRATLSRLPELASALYMLYTNSTTSNTPRDHSRLPVLPLSQVISAVSKSSRVSLSPLEARNALDLLNEMIPGFIEVKTIGASEWASINLYAGNNDAGALVEMRKRVREELSQ
ncbi:unnamed protein product [Sympodiomycopsis kandeliae]